MAARHAAAAPVVSPDEVRPQDACFMRAALELGRNALGTTAPNPCVGALVVRDGKIVGRGVTQPGGRPHAEAVALAQAGPAAQDATLYVTLEPCAQRSSTHFGPSCTEAILAAGIARVVVAVADPNVFAAGSAPVRLRAAGVEVVCGVLGDAAYRLNLGHFHRVLDRRPLVTLKLAQTRDGFAAACAGARRVMITGAPANRRVQWMRAAHDAVMVGIATVRHDDPRLNVRLDLLPPRRPVRIVLDTELSLPLTSRLVRTVASAPVWVLGAEDAPRVRLGPLTEAGVQVIQVPRGADGHLDLRAGLARLAAFGLTRILSEGGPTVAATLLGLNVVDEVVLLTGPRALGDGLPALARDARALVEDGRSFRRTLTGWVGADRLERYERRV